MILMLRVNCRRSEQFEQVKRSVPEAENGLSVLRGGGGSAWDRGGF